MSTSKLRDPLTPICLSPGEPEIVKLVLGPTRARMWPALAKMLKREGLPKVDPMFGGRYWPKVRLFLDDMKCMDDDMTRYRPVRPASSPPGDRTGGVLPRVRERGSR